MCVRARTHTLTLSLLPQGLSIYKLFLHVKAGQYDPKSCPIFQLRAWSHPGGTVFLRASCLLTMLPFLFQLSSQPHSIIISIYGPPPLHSPLSTSPLFSPRIISGEGWGLGSKACCCDLDFKAETVPGADSQRALFLAQPGRATAGPFCLVAPG